MATRNFPPLGAEHPGNHARGLGGLLRSFLASNAGDLPVSLTPPVSNETTAADPGAEKRLQITVVDDFRIEARCMLSGWKVTSIDLTTGLQHSYYVQDNEVYHLDVFKDSPHGVVGNRVNRMREEERFAILQGVRELSAESN
jgi:hypothetical protein